MLIIFPLENLTQRWKESSINYNESTGQEKMNLKTTDRTKILRVMKQKICDNTQNQNESSLAVKKPFLNSYFNQSNFSNEASGPSSMAIVNVVGNYKEEDEPAEDSLTRDTKQIIKNYLNENNNPVILRTQKNENSNLVSLQTQKNENSNSVLQNKKNENSNPVILQNQNDENQSDSEMLPFDPTQFLSTEIKSDPVPIKSCTGFATTNIQLRSKYFLTLISC